MFIILNISLKVTTYYLHFLLLKHVVTGCLTQSGTAQHNKCINSDYKKIVLIILVLLYKSSHYKLKYLPVGSVQITAGKAHSDYSHTRWQPFTHVVTEPSHLEFRRLGCPGLSVYPFI